MKAIDIDSWERKEIYNFFSKQTAPFFSITFEIDITRVKEFSKKNNISFYYTMIWICSKALNNIPEFRMRIVDDELVLLDKTNPSYTVMRKGDSAFMYSYTPWINDCLEFAANAKETADTQKSLFGGKEDSVDMIYFSCMPWLDFTSISTSVAADSNDMIPRITWGKYYEKNSRLCIHICVEVNHRTVDGYHIGLLKKEIEKEIERLI